jgi:6-phospho-3-hexuloisomerase
MSTKKNVDSILAEMRDVFAQAPDAAIPQLAGEIVAARRIVLYGVGRTGLVMQAFAMRLMHLALDAHFATQLATPPIGRGDLLLAVLAVGRLPTADALIASARAAGARVAAVSARPALVQGADVVFALPAQTMADPPTSILPLGSAFELALAILCDLTVVELMARLGRSDADLAGRHANLL